MTAPARWRVEFDAEAAKDLRKLGATERQRVLRYLAERIGTEHDPRRFGKALTGDLAGLWRYRVGDVRIVVTFERDKMIVLVLRVGQRRGVYDRPYLTSA
jgi:mRNA interferase RelE/StbE